MSYNSFGQSFRVTTFGESHGPAVGAVIDGVPPRVALDLEAIQRQLDRRRPGGALASARVEADRVQVLSGLLEGQTTGAPICLLIANEDARPEHYEPLREVLRPGHADLACSGSPAPRGHRRGAGGACGGDRRDPRGAC